MKAVIDHATLGFIEVDIAGHKAVTKRFDGNGMIIVVGTCAFPADQVRSINLTMMES